MKDEADKSVIEIQGILAKGSRALPPIRRRRFEESLQALRVMPPGAKRDVLAAELLEGLKRAEGE